MKEQEYYTTGEIMKLAHITKKTVRYYDEHNILKPSYVDPNTKARYYTDADLGRLQQILLLKYLGFSLRDIREMIINEEDPNLWQMALSLQQQMVEDRIEQLKLVSKTIESTRTTLQNNEEVNWVEMLNTIHTMGLEKSMKNQYQNASNIAARINLHRLYSQNKEGWFPFIFRQCHLTSTQFVLELGCGDGRFWAENALHIPTGLSLHLSDVSRGMVKDAKRTLSKLKIPCQFSTFGCENIPFPDNVFDCVIANHVLFYSKNLSKTCSEIQRVLKPGGTFIASTYGACHMNEIDHLVRNFDDRIRLSSIALYEKFGRENGKHILSPYFSTVSWVPYNDSLIVTDSAPLISYILSCHGNQNQFILDRYQDFQLFVKKQVGNSFSITKDAGIFLCQK